MSALKGKKTQSLEKINKANHTDMYAAKTS